MDTDRIHVTQHAARRLILFTEHIEIPEVYKLDPEIIAMCTARVIEYLKRARLLSPACCQLFLKKGGFEFTGFRSYRISSIPAGLASSDYKSSWGEYYFDQQTSLCLVITRDQSIPTLVTIVDPDERQLQTLLELIDKEEAEDVKRQKERDLAAQLGELSPIDQVPAHTIEVCVADCLHSESGSLDATKEELVEWFARADPDPLYSLRVVLTSRTGRYIEQSLCDYFPLQVYNVCYLSSRFNQDVRSMDPKSSTLVSARQMIFDRLGQDFSRVFILTSCESAPPLLWYLGQYTGTEFGVLTQHVPSRTIVGFNYPRLAEDEPPFAVFKL